MGFGVIEFLISVGKLKIETIHLKMYKKWCTKVRLCPQHRYVREKMLDELDITGKIEFSIFASAPNIIGF